MTTIVVGAGQAGLAVSHELREAGVDHVVLERDQVAHAWRNRWDSFTLVTPNWTLRLPGSRYDGDEPEGHVGRDEIVAFLQDYADHHAAPVREGVAVTSVERGSAARFRLRTDDGDLDADSVVLCTGAYPRPHVPAAAAALARTTPVLDATAYRDPSDLPEGRILVVGSGQTGVQLAEELHQAGRDVVLACGRAPWVPRRIDGVDIVTWLERAGYFDQPLSALPRPQMRLLANVQATGADGGHDLHYRVLHERGVTLTGHLLGVIDGTVSFADDLAASVAFGDARLADARRVLHERLGAESPDLPEPAPFVAEPPLQMPVSAIDAVLVTTGFRPDQAGWVHFPVFDPYGFPVTADDLTTEFPGLFFCGVHFLRNRRSSLLWGVGDDARLVAHALAGDQAAA